MRSLPFLGCTLGALTLPMCVDAQAPMPKPMLPDAQYIALAQSAGPMHVGAHASIARMDDRGMLTELRSGTNDFTCMVGVPGDPEAPICMDQPALQWLLDAMRGRPEPSNTVPGVAYMAKGGVHHETADGEIVMGPGANTKTHREPPHWMLFWPFDPISTAIPTTENASGVYIMFANTPYAHLMVYQDPAKMQPAMKH